MKIELVVGGASALTLSHLTDASRYKGVETSEVRTLVRDNAVMVVPVP